MNIKENVNRNTMSRSVYPLSAESQDSVSKEADLAGRISPGYRTGASLSSFCRSSCSLPDLFKALTVTS